MTACTLNAYTISVEILFSAIALLISIFSWIVIFNIGKIKQALNQLQTQTTEMERNLPELEKALQFKKPNLQDFLLNPLFLTKLVEIIFLFRGGQLTKFALAKTIFK